MLIQQLKNGMNGRTIRQHAMNMSIRLFSMIISNALTIITFVVSNKDSEVSSGTWIYYLVYCGADLVYFFILFLVQLYSKQYNVWEPFLLVFKSNPRIIQCLFVFGFWFIAAQLKSERTK